jgi:DNA gyrase subunit A
MGRTARGVRGMKVADGNKIISMQVAKPETLILTATENGFGKCTPVDDYSTINRGGQGVISIKTTDRNGMVVKSVAVTPEQEIVLITNKGTLVRTRVSEISIVGRNTQGVKLINVGKGEKVVDIAVVDVTDDEEAELEDGVEVTADNAEATTENSAENASGSENDSE